MFARLSSASRESGGRLAPFQLMESFQGLFATLGQETPQYPFASKALTGS